MRNLRSSSTLAAVAAAACLAVSACAGAPSTDAGTSAAQAATFTPVTLQNCGEEVTVEQAPTRLVTLNQGATEVALALGLEDRMAGTAYLDDTVSEQFATGYEQVPVLAEEYPTNEEFLAAEPDFAYAAYATAFEDKAVGTREELAGRGIGTYISPFGCPKGVEKAPPTFESAWNEISEVASIFGVEEKATEVIDGQKADLEEVRQQAAGKDRTLFWYDSGDKVPFVGGGAGGPQLVMDAVGATNIYADLEGNWGDGSWEKVVAAQPDVIVLVEASWDTAETKKRYLASDPVLSQLEAVKNESYVVLPFSEGTPGVRLVEGAQHLSEQLAAMPGE